jgi:manganese/zinc/iron transport system permease protein
MNGLVPPFDFHRVVIEPWTTGFPLTIWIVLMGSLVGIACGLVGNYLLLRRMALVGDAISHSILPGLVVAFLIFRTVNTPVMFAGALLAGLLTVAIIEFIQRQTRVKVDAAICIAFTSLFALGVTLVSAAEAAGPVHIDAECVLFGEIALIPFDPPVVLGGLELGPPPVLRMAAVTLVLVLGILLFYKELLLTSFDPGLARAMGMKTTVWHYGLMTALSLVVVSAFESVGAILAVAMLIVPAMFAAQLSTHLPTRMVLTALHAVASAATGYHLSVWLECSAAAAMVVCGSVLFALAWGITALTRKTGRIDAPTPENSVRQSVAAPPGSGADQ